jgi:PTH1 family peptidyl-tRNA hydrolase
MAQLTHLIVGLGNPGSEYDKTRHNIGFMAADEIAERAGAGSAWKKKFRGLLASPAGAGYIILKPQTYMNVSGESVAEAMRFHKLEPKNVIVFHDDLDLQPSQVKIKQGGGAGGHNGLKSIDQHIGQDYWRVRLGIGHPGMKGDIVSNYVLSGFAKADGVWLKPLIETLAAELDVMLKGAPNDYLARVTQKIKT